MTTATLDKNAQICNLLTSLGWAKKKVVETPKGMPIQVYYEVNWNGEARRLVAWGLNVLWRKMERHEIDRILFERIAKEPDWDNQWRSIIHYLDERALDALISHLERELAKSAQLVA